MSRCLLLRKNDIISANFEYIVSGAENGGEVKGIPGHFFDPQGAQTLVTGMVEIGAHSFDAAGDRSGQFRGLGYPGVMAGVQCRPSVPVPGERYGPGRGEPGPERC